MLRRRCRSRRSFLYIYKWMRQRLKDIRPWYSCIFGSHSGSRTLMAINWLLQKSQIYICMNNGNHIGWRENVLKRPPRHETGKYWRWIYDCVDNWIIVWWRLVIFFSGGRIYTWQLGYSCWSSASTEAQKRTIYYVRKRLPVYVSGSSGCAVLYDQRWNGSYIEVDNLIQCRVDVRFNSTRIGV